MNRLIPPYRQFVLIGIAVAVGLTGSVVVAQQTITHTYSFDDPGEMMMINEFGGMIMLKDSAVTVEMIMPSDNRPDAYKDLDILQGDIIIMVNGSKIKSVEALQEAYDKTSAGDMVKLAISRDGKMMMRKFIKADPESMPKPVVMTMTGIGGDDGNNLALAGVGVMLKAEDGRLSVESLINNIMPKFDGATPRPGDVILKIQGDDYASPQAFTDAYDKIATGETVTLVIERDGKELTTSFVRPKPMETKVMKR